MALSPVGDPSPAQWIVGGLTSFAANVGSLVPASFEAYARVFHPAWLGREDGRTVAWAEIAEENGKTVHPEMQFPALVPPGSFDDAGNMLGAQPDLWTSPPNEGGLPTDVAAELAQVLSRFTSSDECYFAYWDGWGDPVPMVAVDAGPFSKLRQRRAVAEAAKEFGFEGTPRADRDAAVRFETPGRAYYLYRAAVSEVTTPWDGWGGSLPTMWWPADAAWFVHSEIDLDTTYIGGTRACIDALLVSPNLEVLEADLDHGITWNADRVNAPNDH